MDSELAKRVASVCRVLGKLGATNTTLGHVSMRDGDSMLIRGKGPDESGLAQTRDEDIIRVSFDVQLLEGRAGLRQPSESYIHSWIYRMRPDVKSVVHMHPEAAVLLTICGYGVEPIYGSYGRGAQLAIAGLPVYDSSVRICDEERGKDFATFFGDKPAALLRGHGIVAVGENPEQAGLMTMCVKEVTEMNYKARLLGNPKPLPAAEIEELKTMYEEGRALGSAGGLVGDMAVWRAYEAQAS